MATLTGKSVAATYKDLLKVDSASDQAGVDGTLRKVEDGDATATSLSISTTAIAIDATDKLHLDGGGTTYIQESGDGIIDFYSDGVRMLTLTEGSPSTVVINEGSVDMDFRVEGNGEANLLFVDGSTDRVGIGTAAPLANLHVSGTSTSDTNPMMMIECTDADAATGPDIALYRNSTSPADDDYLGALTFIGRNDATGEAAHNVDYCDIYARIKDMTNGTEDATLYLRTVVAGTQTDTMMLTGGNVGIGTSTPENMLEVSSDTSAITRGIGISNYEDGVSSGALLTLRHARGTEASPTASQSGDDLGNIFWRGYDNAGWEAGAYLKCETTEIWDATGHGTKFTFHLNTDNSTGPDEKMCILGSGNVGIGHTIPTAPLHVRTSSDGQTMILESTDAGADGAPELVLWRNSDSPANGDDIAYIVFKGETLGGAGGIHSYASISSEITNAADGAEAGSLRFMTGTGGGGLTEKLRIQGDGNVGIGTESPASTLDVYDVPGSSTYIAKFFNNRDAADTYGLWMQMGADDGSGTTYYINAKDGDGDTVGYLQNASGTFSAADVSDVRLKENIVDTAINGLNKINAIKVRDFKWKKSGDTKTAGLIANELKTVFPEAVSGEEDAMESYSAEYNEDGSLRKAAGTRIQPMSISRESLIPVLIKAVQELSAKVTALESA